MKKSRYLKRLIAALLAALMVFSCSVTAFAANDDDEEDDDDTAFTNGNTLVDILNTVLGNTEEATGQTKADYVSDSTLQYFSTLIGKMSSTSAYRLALEEIYGDALSVSNVVSTASTIWGTLDNDFARNPDAYQMVSNGTNTNYMNIESMKDCLTLMKYTTTDAQYRQLASCKTPAELFTAYANISEENGTGGVYVWDDTSYNHGSTTVAVGDTVLFTITASLGSYEVEGSYTRKIRQTVGEKDYEDKESYTIIGGGSVSYSYIGTVLEVDDSGARAAMGTIDLSGLGAIGDSFRESQESAGQAVSARSDGNGNLIYEVPAEPAWSITVSTVFSHNAVDIQKIVIDAAKIMTDEYGNVIIGPDGKPLTVDVDWDWFKNHAGDYGLSSDEAKNLLNANRADFLVQYMTNVLGYPRCFSVAMVSVMNVETGGKLDPEAHQQNGPGTGLCQWTDKDAGYRVSSDDHRWNDAVAWCNAQNPPLRMDSLEGQLLWMDHELKTSYKYILDQCSTTYLNDFDECINLIIDEYERPSGNEKQEAKTGTPDYDIYSTPKVELYKYLVEEYPEYYVQVGADVPSPGNTPTVTPQTDGTGAHKVENQETLQSIIEDVYGFKNGWFPNDLEGKYRLDIAIMEINNAMGGEYDHINKNGYYPTIVPGTTIYIPTEQELYEHFGLTPG